MAGSIPIVGNLLGAVTDTPKAAAVQQAVETPAPATTDEARKAADEQAVADKKQGRLSNIFTPSANSDQLGSNSATTFTKKLLGQ